VDVLLVGEPEQQDARALQGPAAVVEGEHELLHDVLGHPHVHLARELDEAGGVAVLARLPRQVEGVEGNAVPAPAGAGVEANEAEGLGEAASSTSQTSMPMAS